MAYGPQQMLSMRELSLRMPQQMLSLSMLMVATYPNAALVHSGLTIKTDIPSPNMLDFEWLQTSDRIMSL